MAYKTKCDWRTFKAGDIVPDAVAEKFLENYKLFEHQDFLVKCDDVEEKPKTTAKKTTKKATKKAKK